MEGEPSNTGDGILNSVSAAQRPLILKPWNAIASSVIGELSVNFDFLMGYTPSDTTSVTKPTIVYMPGNNSHTGIANAASNMPGVAAGSWISIYGEKLAGTTRTWAAADIVAGKLPQALDGVPV